MSNVDTIKTNVLPYLFSDMCSMEYDEFNNAIQNMLAGTKKGKAFIYKEIQKVEDNNEYQMFKDRMKQKNVNLSLINDDNSLNFKRKV